MTDTAPHERMERSRKPRKCPTCSSGPVARILYGMPAFSEDLNRELGEGKITLGGCVVSDEDPDWECTACGQPIWRKRA
jgi:hypothetical protein